MAKYEFTLILSGPLGLTEEIADELFEAGCNDGTPGERGENLSQYQPYCIDKIIYHCAPNSYA
ncbi:MAG: hypothetical protein ACT4QB_19910 [Gammaproteobacteria bacterium]